MPRRDRYSTLFSAQAAKSGQFLEGARVVVEAMLQSPKFLFHVEERLGGRFRDYDIASRLSYLLWDTMPDQRLFDAAAKGELRTRRRRRADGAPHARRSRRRGRRPTSSSRSGCASIASLDR